MTHEPYSADPTGKTDSTKAIQAALDAHPSGNRIVYLPRGTYVISDTLRWAKGKNEGTAAKRTILEGESMKETVLKLQDACPGFTEGGQEEKKHRKPIGKPMIWTGEAPAQRFRNAVRNLTIDAGNGNPGAIALQFNTSNQGGVEDLIIRAGEKSGRVGLDLGYTSEIGPLLAQRILIQGFDVGISSWGAVNSITLCDVKLEDQREVAIRNNHQVLSIENLSTRGSVPALENVSGDGVVVLLGGILRGEGAAESAIASSGLLRVRGIETPGFKKAITNRAGYKKDAEGPAVTEFVSHAPTPDPFHPNRAPEALNLAIEPVPKVPWGPLKGWANPESFGANRGSGKDATEAIQEAIDSGAHTVYLPNGAWKLSGTLYLRGNVRRLIGCEAQLVGEAVIEVADGTAPVVVIERFELLPIHGPGVSVKHNSSRTLVLSHMRMRRLGITYEAMPGAGNVFIEDAAGNSWNFVEGQKVWARQINPESAEPMLVNNGADLWILGLKTENDGAGVHAKSGRTEVASAFVYANSRRVKDNPLFIVDEGAEFSVTMGESSFRAFPFKILVRQTRRGDTRDLLPVQVHKRGEGSMISLYRAD